MASEMKSSKYFSPNSSIKKSRPVVRNVMRNAGKAVIHAKNAYQWWANTKQQYPHVADVSANVSKARRIFAAAKIAEKLAEQSQKYHDQQQQQQMMATLPEFSSFGKRAVAKRAISKTSTRKRTVTKRAMPFHHSAPNLPNTRHPVSRSSKFFAKASSSSSSNDTPWYAPFSNTVTDWLNQLTNSERNELAEAVRTNRSNVAARAQNTMSSSNVIDALYGPSQTPWYAMPELYVPFGRAKQNLGLPPGVFDAAQWNAAYPSIARSASKSTMNPSAYAAIHSAPNKSGIVSSLKNFSPTYGPKSSASAPAYSSNEIVQSVPLEEVTDIIDYMNWNTNLNPSAYAAIHSAPTKAAVEEEYANQLFGPLPTDQNAQNEPYDPNADTGQYQMDMSGLDATDPYADFFNSFFGDTTQDFPPEPIDWNAQLYNNPVYQQALADLQSRPKWEYVYGKNNTSANATSQKTPSKVDPKRLQQSIATKTPKPPTTTPITPSSSPIQPLSSVQGKTIRPLASKPKIKNSAMPLSTLPPSSLSLDPNAFRRLAPKTAQERFRKNHHLPKLSQDPVQKLWKKSKKRT